MASAIEALLATIDLRIDLGVVRDHVSLDGAGHDAETIDAALDGGLIESRDGGSLTLTPAGRALLTAVDEEGRTDG
jgi:hypothetical protein